MSVESNFTLEDYVRILNQYQELQQENRQLKERINMCKNINRKNKELLSTLDEIREYINKNSIYFATKEKVGNYFANCSCDELLKILDKVEEI